MLVQYPGIMLQVNKYKKKEINEWRNKDRKWKRTRNNEGKVSYKTSNCVKSSGLKSVDLKTGFKFHVDYFRASIMNIFAGELKLLCVVIWHFEMEKYPFRHPRQKISQSVNNFGVRRGKYSANFLSVHDCQKLRSWTQTGVCERLLGVTKEKSSSVSPGVPSRVPKTCSSFVFRKTYLSFDHKSWSP
jgi:hypothetical protein